MMKTVLHIEAEQHAPFNVSLNPQELEASVRSFLEDNFVTLWLNQTITSSGTTLELFTDTIYLHFVIFNISN